MVTLPVPERLDFARRSIDCYRTQDFGDTELVIVADRGLPEIREALAAHIASLGRDDIRLEFSPGDLSLGALRNLSVSAARGEIVCQWDDDDLHHPERVRRQAAHLAAEEADACYMQELVHFFPAERVMHLVNWRATPAGGHPGTLMARRAAMIPYPEAGPSAARGEDLEVALSLLKDGRVAYLRDRPELYVYMTHGSNTWNADHHRMLAKELSVSRGLLHRREGALRAGLAPFGLPAGEIEVQGSNGPAFRL